MFLDKEKPEIAVKFINKMMNSEKFTVLFEEGMGLVEETAYYLDGEGREQSKLLSRMASLSYATESMRLTTRLMQLASWLLLQRSVHEGEITQKEASAEKNRIKLDALPQSASAEILAELPRGLQDLITRSIRLQERISYLDSVIYKDEKIQDMIHPNPIGEVHGLLSQAFRM